MSARISTFLMFASQAEEAMNFYVSLFPDGAVTGIQRYGPGGPGPDGSVMHASFTLNGQRFMCIDSSMQHEFGFTPAISVFVDCGSEAEVDTLFRKLSDGGKVLMPLDQYPFSRKFAWLADKFGVSLQISLPNA